MRLNLILFCLTSGLNLAFGQDVGAKILDSAKAIFFNDSLKNPKFFHYPLLVVDGEPIDDAVSKSTLDKLSPNELIEIDFLKDQGKKDSYTNMPVRDIVLLLTRSGALLQIKKKLTSHSRIYSQYLELHGDNNDFSYVLNGRPLEGRSDEILKTLFHIPGKKIKKISVLDKYKSPALVRSIIIIKTKKYD